ncbi:olfactory receptor 1019-like [Rhinatrema bivittatum]|uniref:olfactory receptor 1019-like n=1 Tax=Rhinatrema bivittatum TaxID=194408 RepID=UPI00112BE933|nr:olfactory receptor 1019-like [Rhinatrema bivittatum]
MEKENQTTLREFILLGFSDLQELQVPLFLLFLLIYVITVLGNLIIITVTCVDHSLHTPMYCFLCDLSFLDICYSSVTVPRMLVSLLTGGRCISLTECFTQMYFFMFLASTELLLLSFMAYDRYAAICHPLRYTLVMNKRVCLLLAGTPWLWGLLEPVGHVTMMSQFSFCGSHKINHFFCDPTALLSLACADTHNFEMLTFVVGVLVSLSPFVLTLASYTCIITAILRIRSSEGRLKAFSTCSSHLTAVMLLYGTIICIYMRPNSAHSPVLDKFFSLLYTVLIPMLNPIIYSLRNQDVKGSLRKSFCKCFPKALAKKLGTV